ncbi:MAG TPA: hypothetical protein VFW19_18270 [Allosphingosinicella sp.]|nr:hypothetical protein [Allosphingosinicella sp.]
MLGKHLLAAAATAAIALAPASSLAQGADANTAMAAQNSANAAPNNASANPVIGNSAAGGAAAPAAGTADAADPTVPHPVYVVRHSFPWGILGLIGLIGLAPLFRRRGDG